MKSELNDPKKLTALLRRLKKRFSPEPPTPPEPTVQLVLSFLQWEATQKDAEQAYPRLMDGLVDLNELRVSFTSELVSRLGPNYPRAEERLARLREAMNEIYRREHHFEMRSILRASKKEQRAYLDTLPGMTPFVAAQVTLIAFGGHAMPVDSKLAALLANEGVIDPQAEPAEVEGFLARHIKAEDALESHLLLQAWADSRKRPALRTAAGASDGTPRPSGARETTKRRTTTKRIAKKK